MCSEEDSSDIQGGWSRDTVSRYEGRFRGIGKRLDQLKQHGGLVDGKSVIYKCFEMYWNFAIVS
jgi:hypothetical protein